MHCTHAGLRWKVVPEPILIQMVSSKRLYALPHCSVHCTGCQICADISLSRQTSHANSTGMGEESPILRTVKLHYEQVCCIIRLTCIIKNKKKNIMKAYQNEVLSLLYLESERKSEKLSQTLSKIKPPQ